MKQLTRLIITLLLIQLSTNESFAQQSPPFQKDIEAFKKQDSIKPPPMAAILFIGKWQSNARDIYG